VPRSLDDILIRQDNPDFQERLDAFYKAKAGLSHFGFGSEHAANRQKVFDVIVDIINRKQGDAALLEYTEKFDGVSLTSDRLRVSDDELAQAHKQMDADLLKSIRGAIANVKDYQSRIFIGHNNQLDPPTGIRYTPMRRVGVCVPGASAPLPSTVIMTVVPAQVAGVKEIAVVSPPRHEGDIHPVILGVCHELGVQDVYRVGGAQAVAALAYGSETIAPVDKIVGPGNQWVQTAKHLVSANVGIDSIAGPSEVLIIASDQANPAWVAADMLSQAEHNPGSALLFTDSSSLAGGVLKELETQVAQLSRSEDTVRCLTDFSGIVVFDDLDEAIEKASAFAAEHLQIQCGDAGRQVADRIENAGAIFIGPTTPVAVGDYWAGPSHTLPSGLAARFSSAVTSNDFVKSISLIQYSPETLAASADDIIRLAQTEGLDAHARSVSIRQRK